MATIDENETIHILLAFHRKRDSFQAKISQQSIVLINEHSYQFDTNSFRIGNIVHAPGAGHCSCNR